MKALGGRGGIMLAVLGLQCAAVRIVFAVVVLVLVLVLVLVVVLFLCWPWLGTF